LSDLNAEDLMNKIIKLLVIDDEEIVLKSCRRVLSSDDLELDTAFSGEEGLKKVDEGKYDIVITDLMMPGIDGMEVLKRLIAERPEITVIMFTGFATVETTREALKLGAFDYIPKPFTPPELRDVVNNAIKSRTSDSDSKMLDLMAVVSHELKSPLSTVHTTASTLYKGYFGDLQPEQIKSIEAILRNCQYLEDIIRNYLDLSKMDLDNLKSFSEKIDLVGDVIKPVIEIPENENNIRGMIITTDISDKPKLNADPNLLKIVVGNLVSNAIKYGKQGTEIKIRVYKEKKFHIFSIYNEGVGISPDEMESRLFKKFSRLKQKGTEGIKGSGLGLYMCRNIIEKHNGRIWAESEPGKWIKFYFSFPV